VSLWLITMAMPEEAGLLIPRLRPRGRIGRHPAYEGSLAGERVLLLLTGMGQVNAAQAAAAALETRPGIQAVLNLGCAGAYPDSGLALGRAALASEVVLADMGVQTAGRLHDLDKVGIPLLRHPQHGELYNRLPCDHALSERIAAANPGLARGVFATVGRISGDQTTARAVAARWGALLEEMEAAAVALVALRYGRPFAALRGVSNQAGHRELDVAAGAEAAQQALLNLETAA